MDWQTEAEGTIRYNTQVCYKKPVEDILEKFRDTPIRQITTMQIESFLREIAKKGFARQTVKVRLIAFSQICKYALRHGDTNPTASTELPSRLTAKIREIAPEDTLKKIDALPEKGFK